MKLNKEKMDVVMEGPNTKMCVMEGLGGMTAGFNVMPKGTDFTPLLKGLNNNSCHCPHWGYVIEGAMKVIYDDGNEEVISEGDVYYLPAGHTAIVQDDIKLVDFNPAHEFNEVMEHVGKKMAELAG
jgi:hypothetical protein